MCIYIHIQIYPLRFGDGPTLSAYCESLKRATEAQTLKGEVACLTSTAHPRPYFAVLAQHELLQVWKVTSNHLDSFTIYLDCTGI